MSPRGLFDDQVVSEEFGAAPVAQNYNGTPAFLITFTLGVKPNHRGVSWCFDLEQADKSDAFAGLAPSRKKEFVRQVEEAKTEETRQRRIAKVVQSVG